MSKRKFSLAVTCTSISEEADDITNWDLCVICQSTTNEKLICPHEGNNKNTENVRHSAESETPLQVYLGILLHVKTRKKKLINNLSEMGVCISYYRVAEYEKSLAQTLCTQFKESDVVYPPKLQPNIFTSAAIGNIDHNATSSTVSNHFHGTSISLFQHPPGTLEKKGKPLKIKKSSDALSLPNYYTNVKPAPKCKCESPIMLPNECDNHNGYYPLEQMQQWFNRIDLVFSSDTKMPVSWSAFFEEQSNLPQAKCISSLLPLLKDNINSPAVVMPSMKIIPKGYFCVKSQSNASNYS